MSVTVVTREQVLEAIGRRICALVDEDQELNQLVRMAAGDTGDLERDGATALAQAAGAMSQRMMAKLRPPSPPEKPQEVVPTGQYL